MRTTERAIGVTSADLEGRYAGIVSRSGALAVDIIICALISGGIVLFAQAVASVLDNRAVFDVVLPAGAIALIVTVQNAVYYVGGWGLFGRTIGEALFGLRVVRTHGTRLSWARCTVRYLVLFPSIVLFGLGFLWMLVDRRRRTWSDLAARSVVIYDWNRAERTTRTVPIDPVPPPG